MVVMLDFPVGAFQGQDTTWKAKDPSLCGLEPKFMAWQQTAEHNNKKLTEEQ